MNLVVFGKSERWKKNMYKSQVYSFIILSYSRGILLYFPLTKYFFKEGYDSSTVKGIIGSCHCLEVMKDHE